jgi:hypothetical protein
VRSSGLWPERTSGQTTTQPDFGLLAHVSPIQWENVTLYGSYDIRRDLVDVRG